MLTNPFKIAFINVVKLIVLNVFDEFNWESVSKCKVKYLDQCTYSMDIHITCMLYVLWGHHRLLLTKLHCLLQTGEAELPTSQVIEKQSVIIDQLKSKLDLKDVEHFDQHRYCNDMFIYSILDIAKVLNYCKILIYYYCSAILDENA